MNILCAVDGSECSDWAVEVIGTLFHQSLQELCLVNVIDTTHLRQSLKQDGAVPEQVKHAIKSLEKEAKRLLKMYEHKATLAIGQAVTTPFSSLRSIVARGHVAETIVKQTEKRKPDLVVVGSRGASDLRGYLLGSVSRKVLSHAPSAVLTVKGPLPVSVHALIAADGSKASGLAVQKVKSWTLPDSVSLHILSVVPDMLTDIAPQIFSKKRLKALTQPFNLRAHEIATQYREIFLKEGYPVTSDVRTGNPRDVIIEAITKKKTDLAILGSKGLTGVERFQMGSVSEWVAAYASCSVLVVRPSLS